ncbi:unnamed protein product [Phyllotreta striolata]|uniref:ATP synthase-coupling factor 6, mitochondrial n=1 Tax=Phyllotreta striolata TaxID=444603 RepID=A0A9N9TRJ4_PHYSR|nr:unnamed protein product [Phyllotreta striolata]
MFHLNIRSIISASRFHFNVQTRRFCGRKTKEKPKIDPIQQLFLDKLREYKEKSDNGRKLVEPEPELLEELKIELARIDRAYGADQKGANMTEFPTFKFADPKIDPITLAEEEKLHKEREEELKKLWQTAHKPAEKKEIKKDAKTPPGADKGKPDKVAEQKGKVEKKGEKPGEVKAEKQAAAKGGKPADKKVDKPADKKPTEKKKSSKTDEKGGKTGGSKK